MGIGAGDLMERPVEKVCNGVVALDGCAMGRVTASWPAPAPAYWRLYKMEERVADLLGVGDLPNLISDGKRAGVAHLTAHLGVKGERSGRSPCVSFHRRL